MLLWINQLAGRSEDEDIQASWLILGTEGLEHRMFRFSILV